MNNLAANYFYIIFNAFILFFISSVFVEIVLFILKIKNARVRTFLRLFPIIKLPLDIILFQTFHLNFLFNLNPFSCQTVFQEWLNRFFPDPEGVSVYVMYGFFAISLILIGIQAIKYIYFKITIKNILQSASLLEIDFNNKILEQHLKGLNIKIFVSDTISIPFAANFSLIVLPKTLMKVLSREELNAIIAHELEHLRWKDPIVRLGATLISAFFWWIPLKWWLKRIEFDQEQASDKAIARYGIENFSLGTAIVKTLGRLSKGPSKTIFGCFIARRKNIYVKRLENVLDVKRTLDGHPRYANTFIAAALCIGAFASWWIC